MRSGLDVIIIYSGLNFIQNISFKINHISDKFIRNVKSRIYSLSRCICKNYTANHLKFGQELLGLTLSVNPWL